VREADVDVVGVYTTLENAVNGAKRELKWYNGGYSHFHIQLVELDTRKRKTEWILRRGVLKELV